MPGSGRDAQATSSGAVALVHPAAAVRLDQQHVIRVLAALVFRPVHARRANRHARHGQAHGLGALLQQPPDVARRHMAFERIAADLRGVAGAQFFRHASRARAAALPLS